jgi:predicted aldo/keto reductase-like oxidoreductase
LSHAEITTLSMGIHEVDQFPQNLEILNNEDYFSVEDQPIKTRMDAPLAEITGLCTLCNECLPCPEDINIPEVLRFRNLVEGYDMVDFGKYRYNMLEGKGHWFPGTFASKCTECGDCLPRCPENLEIPRLLRQTHRRLFQITPYLKNKVTQFCAGLAKAIVKLFSRK